jgi:hypothetical protein
MPLRREPYSYYTYHIRIISRERVVADVRDAQRQLGEPSGALRFGEYFEQIQTLRQRAVERNITAANVEQLGEALFAMLFDDGLRRDFLGYVESAARQGALLRIELDIDEQEFPELAALPWEFLRVPAAAQVGALWLATAPGLILLRRRALWRAPAPLTLQPREYLRIALAVAAPEELGVVKYEEALASLKDLARTARIELLDPVLTADRRALDAVLRQRPHIFHFIGHARFHDEVWQEKGQIALVNALGRPDWVDADDFSELFNVHRPGVVLQACESGKLSPSQAFVGVASHLEQQNVPVVAAVQFQVSNRTARQFALEFYQQLADGEPVDKAAQQGRRRIGLDSHGYATRDFATPVLFMRVSDGHLFQWPAEPLTEAECADLQAQAERLTQAGQHDDALKLWKDLRDFGPENKEYDRMIAQLQEQQLESQRRQARKLERNQAYAEAIAAWQKIGELGGNPADVTPEIERLRQREQHHARLLAVQQALVPRVKELKGLLYKKVALRLKRIQKEGLDEDGEILLDIVKQFLDRNLSAEEFAETWQAVANPAVPRQRDPNYEALARRLARGDIIPVIGPDVHSCAGLPLPSSAELVESLAHSAHYADFHGPLSMISQYYQMTEYGRRTLVQSVQEMIEPQTPVAAHPLYRLLAAAPTPLLIVSACYDRLLEQQLTAAGRRFVVISHQRADSALTKVALACSDQPEPAAPCSGEALSPLKLLENGYTIVYKVCGCLGMAAKDPNSLLISEEDYFSFARQIEQVIPGYIATQIGRRSLLFLGSPLTDWQDRLLLNAILEQNRANRERSYAVQATLTPYEAAYWKFHGVDVYQVNLRTFLDPLGDYL